MLSRTIAAFVAIACIAGWSFAPAADVDTGPPPGIAAANMTLSQVLLRNRLAVGHIRNATLRTRREQWRLAYGSLAGARTYVVADGDFRLDETLGPTHTARGSIAGRVWSMNANGQVAIGNGLHRQDDVDSAALIESAHPGVSLLGVVAAPVAAYVVRVAPADGRLEYRFYDVKTFLLDRVEEIRDARRMTLTLDDYRATSGLTEPWHIHRTDGFATNDDDEILQSLAIGGQVAPAELAIPASAAPLIALSGAPVKLPAIMSSDVVVVPVAIGGHKVDFILDSGADGIVIDQSVVKALGIKEYGQITSETAGTYVQSDVVVPSMSTGSLVLQNVHAQSLPFLALTDTGVPIAGLLGFDFIHDVVWHIDYMRGTLEAIAPDTFVAPAGAIAVPVTFDDDVPTAAASIGGVAAPAFIIDTGADRSMMFSRFADAHPGQIVDQGLGTAMRASFPFVDKFSGVGGTLESRPIQAGPFVLGALTFPKWLFDVTQNAGAFEFEDYDGLIGQDFLRNFDVYLDYPHAKVYLVPNDRYRQRWER